MAVFSDYAEYYDLYYEKKNYDEEVEYLLALARECGQASPREVLEMGCGTAGHAVPFAKKRISVTGFDLSDPMLERAREKIARDKVEDRVQVRKGDITSYRDDHRYDIVVSMFAVMGYLATNEDFSAGLKTARSHLPDGGLFIFDVWSGSAVLHILPETRIHEFRRGDLRILRLVSPELDVVNQLVSIQYRILTFRGDRFDGETRETHKMRYFFPQELKFFLEKSGFELIKICPFLDLRGAVTKDTWNISVVARAVAS